MRFLAFLLLILVNGAQAQELGRLFFTPEQRAALDARRKARVPDKPAAACPERRANGELAFAGGGPRKEKTRDIGTADKEHGGNRTLQEPQHRADILHVSLEVSLHRATVSACFPPRLELRKSL